MNLMVVLRTVLLTTLALLTPLNAQESVVGLLAQLESGNWTERSNALDRLTKMPDAMRSDVVRAALLSRLDAEEPHHSPNPPRNQRTKIGRRHLRRRLCRMDHDQLAIPKRREIDQ